MPFLCANCRNPETLLVVLLTLAFAGSLPDDVQGITGVPWRGLQVTPGKHWFLTGVVSEARGAKGASVSILTIVPQKFVEREYTAYAFWVGVVLEDGSFLQVGYDIIAGGQLPSYCVSYLSYYYWTFTNCQGVRKTGPYQWQWFLQYWAPSYEYGVQWRGQWGPARSASENGTWNTYSILLASPGFGTSDFIWSFRVNGQEVSNIHVPSSRIVEVAAFAENAFASTNQNPMSPVQFRDFKVCYSECSSSDKSWPLLGGASAYRGYGELSDTKLPSPYSLKPEYGRNASFVVGTLNEEGLPHGAIVWPQLRLDVISQFGSPSGAGWYRQGEIATVSLDAVTVPDPLLGLLGVTQRFDGWYVGSAKVHCRSGSRDVPCELVVNQSMELRAAWTIDSLSLTPTIALLVSAASMLAFFVRRGRKKSKD